MARLIKDGAVAADDWTRLGADFDTDAMLPAGKLIVPLHLWEARREQLLARREPLGIWLDSSEHPEALGDALAHLQLIAINFPVFSDGRGYSCARLLREKYGFTGELRAIGDVLRDQLFLMRRCGFDSFEIRADRDAADALASLGDFTHVYQCATVDPGAPLVLREAQLGAGDRASA
jgi:uncharacterized protein (DUF934 family)